MADEGTVPDGREPAAALSSSTNPPALAPAAPPPTTPVAADTAANPAAVSSTPQIAIFAGGCFWSLQKAFDKLKPEGVISTRVGFSGGRKARPSYQDVATGETGHREAVEVTYDPSKITYRMLVDTYWENIDPYDGEGQFCDKGEQYTTAVFYNSPEQKKDFEASKAELIAKKKVKGKLLTRLLPAKAFYSAEPQHQEYYRKQKSRYEYYRTNCGQDQRLQELWGR